MGMLQTSSFRVLGDHAQPTTKAFFTDDSLAKCKARRKSSFAWQLRSDSDRLQAVLHAECGLVETREGYDSQKIAQLLFYGSDGLLQAIIRRGEVVFFEWDLSGKQPRLRGGRLIGGSSSEDRITSAVQVPSDSEAGAPKASR